MNHDHAPRRSNRVRTDRVRDTLKLLGVTFFGCGLAPKAPGTVGSLGGAIMYGALFLALGKSQATLTVTLWALMVGAASLICVAFGPLAIRRWDRPDPQTVVIDEVAGLGLTYCLLPASILDNPATGWPFLLLGFVFFRFFDIIKPPPVRLAERLPAGWGILADDGVAGLYAGLAVRLVVLLKLSLFET